MFWSFLKMPQIQLIALVAKGLVQLIASTAKEGLLSINSLSIPLKISAHRYITHLSCGAAHFHEASMTLRKLTCGLWVRPTFALSYFFFKLTKSVNFYPYLKSTLNLFRGTMRLAHSPLIPVITNLSVSYLALFLSITHYVLRIYHSLLTHYPLTAQSSPTCHSSLTHSLSDAYTRVILTQGILYFVSYRRHVHGCFQE